MHLQKQDHSTPNAWFVRGRMLTYYPRMNTSLMLLSCFLHFVACASDVMHQRSCSRRYVLCSLFGYEAGVATGVSCV
jgi:putative lipase involved disintegration of autophagic bodies